ncbi:MAG: hypothetical protein HW419_4130 [Deltaproteobacteria bacterium]|nr:hypothetical protein [Deltaproteobacteria bacterium]
MNQPIKLSIAATSKRVDIANIVGFTFFKIIELPRQSQLDIAMGWRDSELGGTGPAILVGHKKYSFGFGNPVGLAAMAYLGRGFYKQKIPLRAIGVFPTWDRLIFAVRPNIGIQSLEDIKKQKYPLRISTRRRGKLATTIYAIEEVLNAYGMSYRDIEKWGGKIMEAPNPSGPERRDAILSGKADAFADRRQRGKTYGEARFPQRHVNVQALRQVGSRHPLRRFQWLDFFLPRRFAQ